MTPILLRQWRGTGKRASLEHLAELCGTNRVSTLVKNPNLTEKDAYSRRREEEIGAINVVEAIHDCIWKVEKFVKELSSVAAVTTSY